MCPKHTSKVPCSLALPEGLVIPSSDKEQVNDAGGLICVCLWLRPGSRPEVRVEEMGM